MVRVGAGAVVPHLPRHHGRRDQPAAVRPARGRGRAGGRLPHRVLVDEVRDVLPGRVHQHDHGLRAGHHAVPGRLAGALAAVPVVGREQRLVAGPVVPDQGVHLPVRLRLAARHAAAGALRPADGARLEVPHPGLHRLDPAGRHRARLAARLPQQGPLRGPRPGHRADPGPDHDVGQRRPAAGRALRGPGGDWRRGDRPGEAGTIEPATGFPVPPLDLPHYHGVGIDNQTSSKEVTGA